MKGHKGYHHTHGTAAKIEAHIRKHRAFGGNAMNKSESPSKGDDDAKKDIEEKPARYNQGKPESEAEEMHAKRGGKMASKKCGMKAGGSAARKNGGRIARASGGGCESNPFTHALKGSGPRASKTEAESEGMND